MRGGTTLLENLNNNGSPGVVSSPINWVGGRTCLAISATAYPSGGTVLQGQGPNPNVWINVNSSSITTNGFYIYDLPPGQYRMAVGVFGGTTTAMYAKLVSIPYTM